ncbi:hypothetical protein KA183_20560 [bacterium]|nr:hypothetical protein [bacterium]QQR55761.1 MAG: hypothetical protein IPG59_12130 [Candidatus Melainabacteria bacterium]
MIEFYPKNLIKGRIADSEQPAISARYKLNDIFCTAWLSHAVTAIVEHKIADLLNEKPVHVDELSQISGLHSPTLYRVMRALAANGIFVETRSGEFAHNEVSNLLKTRSSQSWAAMAKMWNHPSCINAWLNFADCLADGRSGIEHAFGKPLYEHLDETDGATKAFADAMISNSAQASAAIAQGYDFGKYKTVVDIGGGVGTLLVALLKAHPHLKGYLFEIESLKKSACNYLQSYDVLDRSEIVVGDFFESVPSSLDLYLIKNSLWNWDDQRCSIIIQKIRDAIAEDINARFLIIEYVIDKENAEWSTLYDLQILNMPGGKARTRAEYTELLNRNGFALEEVLYVQDQTILVAAPI